MAARPGPIVAAILVPPLGTYLAKGPGRDFWITCGLTVLGFVPGVGFALWSVLRNPEDRQEAQVAPATA